jgi:hypothetical protein
MASSFVAIVSQITGAIMVAPMRSRFALIGKRWRREAAQPADDSRSVAEAVAETQEAATGWEKRVKEAERAREQIARRLDAARRDVYAANLDADTAREAAARADAAAALATARAERAEAGFALAASQAAIAEAALASVEKELARVVQERDALVSSTIWRATAPLRAIAGRLPPGPRRVLSAFRRAVSLRI